MISKISKLHKFANCEFRIWRLILLIVFMLSMATNRAEPVCDIVKIEHNNYSILNVHIVVFVKLNSTYVSQNQYPTI